MTQDRKGAKEFEAMLLSTWLQQAEQSFATVPGAEDDDDAAGRDQMMSLGVQSLADVDGGIGRHWDWQDDCKGVASNGSTRRRTAPMAERLPVGIGTAASAVNPGNIEK
jgi:hypothetical protein